MSSADEATATPTTAAAPVTPTFGAAEGVDQPYLDVSKYSAYTLSRLSAYNVSGSSAGSYMRTTVAPYASAANVTRVTLQQQFGATAGGYSSSGTFQSTVSPCNPCGVASNAQMPAVSPCNPCGQYRAQPVIAAAPINPCRPCGEIRPAAPVPSPCRPCEVVRQAPAPCRPCAVPTAPAPCRPCEVVRQAPAPCRPCAPPAPPSPCRPCAPPAPAPKPCAPCGAPGTPCADKAARGGYIRIGNEYHPVDSDIARRGQGYAAPLPTYSSMTPTSYTTTSGGTYTTVTEQNTLSQPYTTSQYGSAVSQYGSQYAPAASQYVPAASQYVEVPSQYVPAASQYVEVPSEYARETPQPFTVYAKKVIVVFGATGSQGRGLVDAILADANGPFSVRAVTRDATSAAAQEIASLGAEVVEASLDDPESVDRALEGAYGAYFVTFFWDHFNPEKETQHAVMLAEAAKKAGLQHVIWSTLEDTRRFIPLDDPRMPTLYGKYKVAHFDAKGEADDYFRELGVPTTFLLTSFYWDNFVKFGMGPKRGPDGKLAITLPIGDVRMAQIWAGDIGRCAYGILKGGAPYIDQYVGVAGDHLTGDDMADAFTRALGEEVVYNPVPPDVYRSFGFPGADDLGNMFQFYTDFAAECCAARDIQLSLQLNPGLLTLDQWLQQFKHLLTIEAPVEAAANDVAEE